MEYHESFNDDVTGDVRDLISYKKVSIFLFGWPLEHLKLQLNRCLKEKLGENSYQLLYDGPDTKRHDCHLFTLEMNSHIKNNRQGVRLLEGDF